MKFSTQPQFVRMQAILDSLRSGDFPNASDFMRQFEVSRQTVVRDLNFMKSEWGAPIEYDASEKGYYLANSTWQLPRMTLDRREVFALGIAQKLAGAFRGTPLESEMQSALQTIANSLQGQVSIPAELLTRHVSVVGEDYAQQNMEIWTQLLQCIERRQQIDMIYGTFRGEQKQYVTDPYHLAAYHGDWYLLGFHHRRKQVATFAVSRIQKVSRTGAMFTPPPESEIRKKVEEGFGITGGGEVFTVRLMFSPTVAQYIAGRIWHPSQEIVEHSDGSAELRMETSGWKELVRFVLSWLPDVEVLEPEILRKRIRKKIETAASR